MEYEERLRTLLHLFAEISNKIVKELEGDNNQQKINEYSTHLQQIDQEVKRIEQMRGYRPDRNK
jgi:outer membrane murein-binding lipoprotein Lpp